MVLVNKVQELFAGKAGVREMLKKTIRAEYEDMVRMDMKPEDIVSYKISHYLEEKGLIVKGMPVTMADLEQILAM